MIGIDEPLAQIREVGLVDDLDGQDAGYGTRSLTLRLHRPPFGRWPRRSAGTGSASGAAGAAPKGPCGFQTSATGVTCGFRLQARTR